MKKSKIKKLASKKEVKSFLEANGNNEEALHRYLRETGAETIAKMRSRGYDLVTFLETGEGIFVRDDDVIGLHIQLPVPLYRRLERACEQREATKRSLVVEALERHLPATEDD